MSQIANGAATSAAGPVAMSASAHVTRETMTTSTTAARRARSRARLALAYRRRLSASRRGMSSRQSSGVLDAAVGRRVTGAPDPVRFVSSFDVTTSYGALGAV